MDYLLPIHSILRWAVVLFGLWTLLNALSGVFTKRAFTPGDNRTSFFFTLSCDIQLLLGLILYFNNSWFNILKSGQAMANGTNKFFAMEHAASMIIAWILVHVGRSVVRRGTTDAQKHKRALIFFGIAILLILAMIPWPFRNPEIARQWFRSF